MTAQDRAEDLPELAVPSTPVLPASVSVGPTNALPTPALATPSESIDPQQENSKSASASASSTTPKAPSNQDTASPYGTRSKGRSGRVNYREDTEDDDLLSLSSRRANANNWQLDSGAANEGKLGEKKRKLSTSSTTTLSSVTGHARSSAKTNGSISVVKKRKTSEKNGHGNALGLVAEKSSGRSTRTVDRKTSAGVAAKSNGAVSRSSSLSVSKSTSPTPPSSAKPVTRRRKSSSVTKVEVTSSVLDFSDAYVKDGSLCLSDGSIYSPNDCIYLVSEPPGEPYYIGRIMEFAERHEHSPAKIPTGRNTPVSPIWDLYQVRINWFYRPKDIPTRSNDSRLLFATMHSDLCPLLSMRGKCVVTHRAHIKDLVEYRKAADHFWFDKLYDRYICRMYELIPTEKILNVPQEFGKVLRERVKFGIVEIGRGKDLCSVARNCTRCGLWCSPDESVCCAVCGNDYHMSCVRPALLKKPSRGFAWACAVCSRDRERKLAESKGKLLPGSIEDVYEDEVMQDSEGVAKGADGSDHSGQTTPEETDFIPAPTLVFKVADDKLTDEQKRELSMWPYRYLGIHCKLEEVLDNNDRIFPRAASRLGNKHQAIVPDWGGRPVQFINRDPAKSKKKKQNKAPSKKSSSQDDSSNGDAVGASSLSLDDPWVQERPLGYLERGGEGTATLLWKPPSDVPEEAIDAFLVSTKPYAKALKMLPSSPNFIDKCLTALMNSNFDAAKALEIVAKFTRKSLKEPTLTAAEVKKFEDGVRKYGSELHPVYKAVGTVSSADIVRFYYLWKKTPNGHAIWDHFEGRKGKNPSKAKTEESVQAISVGNQPLVDNVADSQDDSAYDMDKAVIEKQSFQCKFCKTTKSRAWRRAPGHAVAKSKNAIALCLRCAELWRRYAVIWEDPNEVLKKSNQRGSHGQKRKVEEELLRELDEGNRYDSDYSSGLSDFESDFEDTARKIDIAVQQENKKMQGKKPSVKEPEVSGLPKNMTPLAPGMPTACGVCGGKDQLLRCHDCGMCVHKSCYGVRFVRRKWRCDPCMNDRHPCHSMDYSCVICPAKLTAVVPHAEKSPRDALKVTAGDNWVHVTCAIWTPEIRFVDSYAMSPAEGVSLISKAKFVDICDICRSRKGACTSCAACHVPFHIGCARKENYRFGFDIQPVKSTRRDSVPVVKLGIETGSMTPMIWCPRHNLQKLLIHDITEAAPPSSSIDPAIAVGGGVGPEKTALNVYSQTYKQADLSLTGTMRRAQQVSAAVKFYHSNMAALKATNKGRLYLESLHGVPKEEEDDDAEAEELARREDSAGTISASNSDTESAPASDKFQAKTEPTLQGPVLQGPGADSLVGM